jgi:hypothetical protein
MMAGANPAGLAAGDFDSDGDTDLVVVNFEGNDISILINSGGGVFTERSRLAVGEFPSAAHTADLNGDELVDIVVTNFVSNDATLYLGRGDGTFDDVITIDAGWMPAMCQTADLDGDSHLDLMMPNRLATEFATLFASNITVRSGQGGASFSTPREYLVGDIAEWLTAGDFNDDGWPDIAVVVSGSLTLPDDPGELSVLINRGDGTFYQNVVHEAGSEPGWVATLDVDGDADLDLLTTDRLEGALSIFLNAGDGTFGILQPWVDE